GWLKLEFQEELKSATEEAEQAGLLSEPNPDEKNQPIYEGIYNQDPRLSLAGLRIALERRLRELAKLAGAPGTSGRSLDSVVRELNSAQILTEDQADALYEIIPLLNRAVRSENFNQAMADWAINIGPKLIAGLEQKALKAGGTRDRLWGNT